MTLGGITLQVKNDIATFDKNEVKIILSAINVQIHIKSNSSGDQTGLDTPGIADLHNLYDHINDKHSITLSDADDFDSDPYGIELQNYLKNYIIYSDSMNTLTAPLKKACKALLSAIKKAYKA